MEGEHVRVPQTLHLARNNAEACDVIRVGEVVAQRQVNEINRAQQLPADFMGSSLSSVALLGKHRARYCHQCHRQKQRA